VVRVLACWPGRRRGQGKTSPLFIIERNLNAKSCITTPGSPPTANWIQRAGNRPTGSCSQGRSPEKLTWTEKKKAYGFAIKPDPSVNGYKMTLWPPRSADHREEEKDAVRAEAVIDGRRPS